MSRVLRNPNLTLLSASESTRIFSPSGATHITDRYTRNGTAAKCARSGGVAFEISAGTCVIPYAGRRSMFHFRLSMYSRVPGVEHGWLSDGLDYVVSALSPSLAVLSFARYRFERARHLLRENRSILLAMLEISSRKLHRQPSEGSRDYGIFMRCLAHSKKETGSCRNWQKFDRTNLCIILCHVFRFLYG